MDLGETKKIYLVDILIIHFHFSFSYSSSYIVFYNIWHIVYYAKGIMAKKDSGHYAEPVSYFICTSSNDDISVFG